MLIYKHRAFPDAIGFDNVYIAMAVMDGMEFLEVLREKMNSRKW